MLKSIVLSGLVGAFVVATSSLAYSQTSTAVPQMMAQANSTTEISPEELQQFAQTLKQLRQIEVQAQQQMAQAVQAQGLTPERFMEILGQNQQNQDSQPAADVSGDEKEKFDQALTQVRGILQEAESQKLQVLQAQGMEPERFNQIIAAVQEQPSLQQQVQQLLQN